VREHLDEGVLDGLVGLRWIAKVLVSDAHGAPLVKRNQFGEPVARRVHVAAFDESANFDREP
jgi:hypothetical protein